MRKTLLYLVLFLVAIGLIVPVASAKWRWKRPKDKIRVMTRNLYLGGDIFKVLEAAQNPDPANQGLDVPIAVAKLFQTVQYTNFPERAEALANEIWFLRPHLIGLQEVSKWYVQSPSDFFKPFPPDVNPDQQPAGLLVYDYLEILLGALAARNLNYYVAVESVGNADVELPALTGFSTIPGITNPVPTFDDVRLVDRDVILVRGDVGTSNPSMASYEDNVSQSIGGIDLAFTRGWVAVDAEVKGEVYCFVNTHLEIRNGVGSAFRFVQSRQMQELLEFLSDAKKQVILVGDFNSSPDDVPGEYIHPIFGPLPYVPPYMLAKDFFGYVDAWDLLFWPRNGYTDGFSETLDDPYDQLTSRIDLIFLSQHKKVRSVFGLRTGVRRFSRTPSGLWPSDHAGVFTRIVFRN